MLLSKIAGVILNGILCPGDVEDALDKLEQGIDEGYKNIFRLLYSENLKVNLFERFNVVKIFDLRILSVDGKFRGKGIAKTLVQNSEELARQLGYKVRIIIINKNNNNANNIYIYIDAKSGCNWNLLSKNN